jgi:glutathione S-transferase
LQWFPLFGALRDIRDEASKTSILEKIFENTTLLEDAFAKISKGKDFFGGETIGYLDIVLGCFLVWIRVAEIRNKVKILEEAKTPRLVRWAKRFSSEIVTQGISPDPQDLDAALEQFLAAKAALLANLSEAS